MPESLLRELTGADAPLPIGLVHEGSGVTVDGHLHHGPGGHDHFPAA